MLKELSNKEYITARTAVNAALQSAANTGVDITTSTFKALFKAGVMKLYDRILDDPKTYEVPSEEKEEQINE